MIVDGTKVDAENTNSKLASKTNDNTLQGKQTLDAPGSGPIVNNLQLELNNTKDQASNAESISSSALSSANAASEAVNAIVNPEGNLQADKVITEFIDSALTGVDQEVDFRKVINSEDVLVNKIIFTDGDLVSINEIVSTIDDDGLVQVLPDGFTAILVNETGGTLNLIHGDSGVTIEENRLDLPGGNNFEWQNKSNIFVSYSGEVNRWQLAGGTGAGGSGGGGSSLGNNFIPNEDSSFDVFGDINWDVSTLRKIITGSTASTNIISATDSLFLDGTEVKYIAGATPITGLTSGNNYFVINSTGDDVQLSATLGGSAIGISTNGGDGYLVPLKPIGVINDVSYDSALSSRVEILSSSDEGSPILNGDDSALFIKKATQNSFGDAFSLRVDIPIGYRNRFLGLDFLKAIGAGNNIVDGDYKIYLRDDAGKLLPLIASENSIDANATPYKAFVFVGDTAYLDVIIYVETDQTNLRYLITDDFFLGAKDPVFLANSVDYSSTGPTIFRAGGSLVTKGTTLRDNLSYSVSGGIVYIKVEFEQTTAGSGTGIYEIDIPEEVNKFIDFNKIPGDNIRVNTSGVGWITTGGDGRSIVSYVNKTNKRLSMGYASGTNVSISSTTHPLTGGISFGFNIILPSIKLGSIETLAKNSLLEKISNSSSTITPAASGNYLQGSQLDFKAGKLYKVGGYVQHTNAGSVGYTVTQNLWRSANGANTSSIPGIELTDMPEIDVIHPDVNNLYSRNETPASQIIMTEAPELLIFCKQDVSIFLVPRPSMGTPANARVRAFAFAVEQPFSQTALFGGAGDHELYLDTGNGHGSTNTVIRRFSNIRKNTLGHFATYADSASLGMSITINVSGNYTFSYSDIRLNLVCVLGFSVNSSNLSTSIGSLSYAQGMRKVVNFAPESGTSRGGEIGLTLYLKAGDVLRAHGNGNSDGTSTATSFQFKFIGY